MALLTQKLLLRAESPRVLLVGGPLHGGGSQHPGWRDSHCALKRGAVLHLPGCQA